MSKEKLKRFGMNLLKFTAPMLAVFFYQLSSGVPIQDAAPLLILSCYGALADWLKKLGE